MEMVIIIALCIVLLILVFKYSNLKLRNNNQAKIIVEYGEEINRLRNIVKQCDDDRREIISKVCKN